MLKYKNLALFTLAATLSLCGFAHASGGTPSCFDDDHEVNCSTLLVLPHYACKVIKTTLGSQDPSTYACMYCGYNAYTDGKTSWRRNIYQGANITNYTVQKTWQCDEGGGPGSSTQVQTCSRQARKMIGSQQEGSCPSVT